ncbi:MAG: hypothetical protein ACI8Y4_005144 [Candidatus Poriferisodalaceae bacterium]|jgi:hypothetical protein
MSNPITGDFEPLPAGYEINPNDFFDGDDGWRPLLLELRDVEFFGEEQRNGTRYHLRGIASADRVEVITAGLVVDQDVALDFWVHPVTALITGAEFSTLIASEPTEWRLELSNYGKTFNIQAPDGLA